MRLYAEGGLGVLQALIGPAHRDLRQGMGEGHEYWVPWPRLEPSELFRLVMEQVEPPMIEAVLACTRGNQSRAAQMLGINRGTLRKKIKLYGLD